VIPYPHHAARNDLGNVAEATALSVALQLCVNQLQYVIDHGRDAPPRSTAMKKQAAPNALTAAARPSIPAYSLSDTGTLRPNI
jgi:hypothetical protein